MAAYQIQFSTAFLLRACTIAIAVLLAVTPVALYAQAETGDFTYQYRKYLEDYPQFTTVRDQYLKQKTLSAGNEAITKTQAILVQRAQTLRTYFLALRYKLNNTPGVSTDKKASLGAALNNNVFWLDTHMNTLQGMRNPVLSDLFQESDNFERQEKDYKLTSYQTLAEITTAKVYTLHEEFIAVNAELRPYVEKSQSGYMKNWLNETQNISFQITESLKKMQTLTDDMAKKTTEDTSRLASLASLQKEAEEARKLLVKGIGYQKEIIGELERTLPKVEGAAVVPAIEASTSADTE